MRFISWINESNFSISDYSWEELFTKHEDSFKKWLFRKKTELFKNKWTQPNRNLSNFETKTDEGYTIQLFVNKDVTHKKSGSTRDPDKTRKNIKIKLLIDLDGSKEQITLYDKTTKGEDLDKMKKWDKQLDKAKDFLQNTFGISNV